MESQIDSFSFGPFYPQILKLVHRERDFRLRKRGIKLLNFLLINAFKELCDAANRCMKLSKRSRMTVEFLEKAVNLILTGVLQKKAISWVFLCGGCVYIHPIFILIFVLASRWSHERREVVSHQADQWNLRKSIRTIIEYKGGDEGRDEGGDGWKNNNWFDDRWQYTIK